MLNICRNVVLAGMNSKFFLFTHQFHIASVGEEMLKDSIFPCDFGIFLSLNPFKLKQLRAFSCKLLMAKIKKIKLVITFPRRKQFAVRSLALDPKSNQFENRIKIFRLFCALEAN